MADAKQARWLYPLPFEPGVTAAAQNQVADANNDGVGWAFAAENTEAITHIGFRYGARTGTPPTYVLTLEGLVTTTGLPDGTDVGGGSPTAVTFTPPADATWDGTWRWIQLTNSYTPTRDQKLAATIRYSSGTVDGSNNASFTRNYSNSLSWNFPYALTLTAGTWAVSANCLPLYGIRTANTRYGQIATGDYATRTASTVGHRAAMKFTIPTSWCSTFKVKGVIMDASIAGAAGKAPVLGLWSAGGVIQNSTQDSDFATSITNSARTVTIMYDEASLTALNAGTAYYAGMEVADAVNGGVIIRSLQLSEANDLLAYPGGTDVHFATFDGSNWSDAQTVRPIMALLLDDITAPSGGGPVGQQVGMM